MDLRSNGPKPSGMQNLTKVMKMIRILCVPKVNGLTEGNGLAEEVGGGRGGNVGGIEASEN